VTVAACSIAAVVMAPQAFASPVSAFGAGSHGVKHVVAPQRLAASSVRALNDVSTAIPETLPFSVTGIDDAHGILGPWDNVYRVSLTAGQTYWFWLDGPTTADLDLFLYNPDATTVDSTATIVDGSAVDGSQEWFSHYADRTGYYYVDVYAYSGSGSFTLHGDLLSHQDPDADIAGATTEAVLPFTASDSLTVGSDTQDGYKVWLNAGQSAEFFMTGQVGTDFSLILFPPGTTAVWSDQESVTGAYTSGTRYESMFYKAPVAGYYYPMVYMFWYVKVPHPLGGTYTLAATTANTFPTSISIKTNLTSVKLPKPFELSGVLANGMGGDPCVVDVKKPGSSRWSYSSKRLVYSISATSGGSWWYRYTPKLKGKYAFRVRYAPDSPALDGGARAAATSPNIVYVTVK
jgi:predicted ribosomally synthesized peptide with SipW-like signal peptide